jgi:protein-S-isoprenylcysteine O-methyltransferase Ste14
MALLHSFEKSGNTLFKYRGQIPVILFIFAVPVIYFTEPTFLSEQQYLILTYIAIATSLLGFLFRAYAIGTTPKGTSGRNTSEQIADILNTTGIYACVRHPLYVGNYFMWIGIVMFTFNIYYVVAVSLAFWIYYERIMFAEERFLERKFGQAYLDWSMKVPAFIPALSKYTKSTTPLSILTVIRREYTGILATVFSFTFIDNLRFFFQTNDFDINRLSYKVLAATFIYAFILRTLKHHTKVLNEEGRS